MQINGRDIGPSHPPYFIAEAGVNHNGDLSRAKSLVEAAADAGADAVKFQTFSADRLVTKQAAKPSYQTETTGEGTQYDLLRRYELDEGAHEQLMDHCAANDITFLSTPFDAESASMLVDLGVPAIKLGSGELDNYPLIEHVATLGVPMIVSTGMGTMDEVHAARETIRSVSTDLDLAFLHCTSSYPCSIDDVNLRAMATMDAELPDLVGYSDHTTLVETPAFAVAAGATILEKHFTLDRSLPGPDHEASLEPDELASAVELAETAWRTRGTDEKRPTDAERDTLVSSRKSLHAATDIPAGTTLEADHIRILRPSEGLSPRWFDAVVGTETTRAIASDDPISAADLAVDPTTGDR
ncbi:N-acetylneuraminate synthase family protein [Halobaculum litoreum]|uniref:N-acetylneuraminate synthase family protein n=1 Tax=Halobaculum litoreum TaxID=3031998 RepID=UPI0024C3C52A|nr:N-acetylneuraminate synthase family protein [Halobaculum sp. DT92]